MARSINLSLTDELRAFLDQNSGDGTLFATPSEFVRAMIREKKERDDSGPKVPAYLVSFGDMMTILLTFFILLCTYATQRKSGFVADGIGSFRLAIEALGLPGFLSSDRLPTNQTPADLRQWLRIPPD